MPDDTTVRIRVLGRVTASVGTAEVNLGRPHHHLTLAVLVAAGRVRSVDALIDDLWGDDPPARPKHSLQNYVSRLRKHLGRSMIETVGDGYRLAASVATDARTFEGDVDAARRAWRARDPGRAAAMAEAALANWEGEAYEDIDVDVVRAEAARLTRLRLDTVDLWARAALTTDHDTAAIAAELRPWAEREPLREPTWALLARALHASGRQADALDALRELSGRLRDELGVDLGAEAAATELAILRDEPDDSPDAASTAGAAPLPALPRDRTSFVGRAGDLERIAATLDTARCVTVVGLGGIGKTRVALQAARQLRDRFPDGARWVGLAGLPENEHVQRVVAEACGLALPPVGDPLDAVVGDLRDRAVLLVVDNAEHVLDGVRTLAEAVLDSTSQARLLVTSRAPLSLSGEQVVRLGPLDVDRDATTLFVERARAAGARIDHDTPGVGALVRQLDGLPLAVELAASQSATIPLEHLVERLDRGATLQRGAPARQRTLDGVLAWSTEQLDAETHRLARALAEVATPLATADAATLRPDQDVVDGLARLVAAGLVELRQTALGGRYTMLAVVARHLRVTGADHTDAAHPRDDHLRLVTHWVDDANDRSQGQRRDEAADQLQEHIDDLRRALDWSLTAPRLDDGRTLAAKVWRFWQRRGHLSEGQSWLERLVAANGGATSPRAHALVALAGIRYWQGAYDDADARYHEALELHREHGDLRAEADTLAGLMSTAYFRRRPDDLARYEREAVAAYERLDDPDATLRALTYAGIQRVFAGQPEAGRDRLRRAQRLAEEQRNGWLQRQIHIGLLRAALDLHETDDAVDLGTVAARQAIDADDRPAIVQALDWLGVALVAAGRERLGVSVAGTADRLRQELGSALTLADRGLGDRRPDRAARARLGVTEVTVAFREGRERSPEQALAWVTGATG